MFHGRARPVRVTAAASTGVATSKGIETEDSITLTVLWENLTEPRTLGTAVYTASWVAPKSDVHSQQRFFMMLSGGEINVDQAHRGYSVATDAGGEPAANCEAIYVLGIVKGCAGTFTRKRLRNQL